MFNWFKKKRVTRITLNRGQIFRIVKRQLGSLLLEDASVRFADTEYNTVLFEEGFKAVLSSQTLQTQEINDCDDSALMAKAEIIKKQRNKAYDGKPAAFGIMWTPLHAFNWLIDEELTLRLIDNDGREILVNELKGNVDLMIL